VIGLLRGAALLLNTDAYEALGDGVDYIAFAISFVALAMSFVSCRSSVVVLLVSAASFTA
jgi:hypothetical protein